MLTTTLLRSLKLLLSNCQVGEAMELVVLAVTCHGIQTVELESFYSRNSEHQVDRV